ncbi:hypothetical protein [Mycobacterium servetii]|uniref:Uncharacterized protein n=1 Tax=Mycobacterium servetii TaxID=3237418 RepID=A0ABV4C8P0_9MYCO
MNSFEQMSVDALLVRVRAARVHRDWLHTGRRRGPARFLTVVEKDSAGASQILAYLPMADERDQRAAFEFPGHVVVRSERMYAVEKLAADGVSVDESRFVSPEQAAMFLLEVADLDISEDLLRQGGLCEFLAYFRAHPIAKPALTEA